MTRPGLRVRIAIAFLASTSAVPAVADWYWPFRFTGATSPDLETLHSEIHRLRMDDSSVGTPVENLVFRADGLEIRFLSGTLHPETPLDGVPTGAWFEGEARLTFDPPSRTAATTVRDRWGGEGLKEVPIRWAYVFTLRGTSVHEQIGASADPTVPWRGSKEYEGAKSALRMTGLRLLHAVLNREGRSKDAVFVVFAPEALKRGAPDAHFLYAHDPNLREAIALQVFGHPEAIFDPFLRRFVGAYEDLKHRWWPVASSQPDPPDFEPHARTVKYDSRVRVEKNLRDASVETTVTIIPGESIPALGFEFSSRLEIQEIVLAGGGSLRFAQWQDAPSKFFGDTTVVVRFPAPLLAGKEATFTVRSAGPIFDPGRVLPVQSQEDLWIPMLDDPEGAIHEVRCVVPKNLRAVSAGQIVSEEVNGDERHVHFRTARPVNHTTFYVGPYDSYESDADGIPIEFLVARPPTALSNPKYAVEEIANAVRVYNRLLPPLEAKSLRVATTPTYHGRGFEGLILLSQGAGSTSADSTADLFRAHEVAHQWWGGMVISKRWPEDRWLTESFAEFMAMEYYDVRFQKPEKTAQVIRDYWTSPMFLQSEDPVKTLSGDVVPIRTWGRPLTEGGQNVYKKGPLVLRHLRYLFTVQKKGDDAFWELLQEFLKANAYKPVSTEEFIEAAERKMGGKLDWFWDQWVYGSGFPRIRWSHDVSPHPQGGYLLTVEAKQESTEFILPIPVHVHMGGDKVLTTHLAMRGKERKIQVRLKERPTKVTLNDDWMAPIELLN